MSYLIYAKIDRVMIKEMMDEYSVGIYSAAYVLSVDDAHVGGLCRTNIRLFLLGNFLHGISKLFLCIFCGKYVLLRRRYVC